MTDLVENSDAVARLERALARVETAVARSQAQQARAQQRYNMLDRACTETLAAMDGLLSTAGEPEAAGDAAGRPRWVKLAAPDPVIAGPGPDTTADAA